MYICVDGPALEDFDVTESINVWLSDSGPPSTPVILTLVFERLIFLFDWGENLFHLQKNVSVLLL